MINSIEPVVIVITLVSSLNWLIHVSVQDIGEVELDEPAADWVHKEELLAVCLTVSELGTSDRVLLCLAEEFDSFTILDIPDVVDVSEQHDQNDISDQEIPSWLLARVAGLEEERDEREHV